MHDLESNNDKLKSSLLSNSKQTSYRTDKSVSRRANEKAMGFKNTFNGSNEKWQEPDESSVELAAAYLDDAYRGQSGGKVKRPRLQRFWHNASVLYKFFMINFTLLPFFERPAWCFSSSCGNPSVSL